MVRIHPTVRLCRISRKSGNCNIEFAISHKSRTKYVSSGIECLYENFSKGRISDAEPDSFYKNMQLDNKLCALKKKFDDVRNPLLYDLNDLIVLAETISDSAHGQHPTFFNYLDYYVSIKRRDGKDRYANMLLRTKVVFADWMNAIRFCGDIRLEDMNSTIINKWKDWMLNERKLSIATTGMYLGHAKAIINHAISHNSVTYLQGHPFADVTIGKSPVRRSDISLADFITFRDADLEFDAERRIRDIWMLSFYLCGMNYVDMIRVKFPKDKKILEYCRKKTEHKVTDKVFLPLCYEARELIEKYRNEEGYLVFPYVSKYTPTTVSHKIKIIAQKLGIPPFSFYSARKTFSQLAFESGVPMPTIDYLLAHSSTSQGVIRHYVHEDVKVLAKAVRQVYDYVKTIDDKEEDVFANL